MQTQQNITPMNCTYGYSHFIHFKTVATEVEIQFLSTLISLLPPSGSAFFSSKEGGGVFQYFCPYNECTSHWCLVMIFFAHGLHLKSHQRCSAGIRICLPADRSSSSTLTESSFLFDPCLIHSHVRIEKGPVQTVAITFLFLLQS